MMVEIVCERWQNEVGNHESRCFQLAKQNITILNSGLSFETLVSIFSVQ